MERHGWVDASAGVAGSIGAAATAKSPPDGYALVVGNVGPVAINAHVYRNIGYDPLKDFTPITLAVAGPQLVVVHPSVPAKTFKEFVVLPDDANRLRSTVHEAAFKQGTDEEKGRVVTVTGAKGGVGTTTLAVHLAAELAGIHRVLLLDLDFGIGDVAPIIPQWESCSSTSAPSSCRRAQWRTRGARSSKHCRSSSARSDRRTPSSPSR